MPDSDAELLEQIRRDIEYRKRLDAERAKLWNRAAVVAACVTAFGGLASLVAKLLHVLGLSAR